MNDRFKFRGYWYNDTQKGWWVFDEPEFITGDGTAEIWYNTEGGAEPELPSKAELHLCQCTGLKDKNGKLIYEGDILKGKKDMMCSPHSSKMVDKVGVVEIPQNMFVASCRDVKNNCTLFCQFDWVKAEVIGNIYENKELLESEG